MNWDAVGSLAEVFAALAVMVTLIYLAVQVRQSRELLEENRKIALSQVYSSRTSQRLDDLRQNIDSPYVAGLMAEDSGLSEDQIRHRSIDQRSIFHFDNILFQNELGLIADEDIHRITNVILRDWDIWEKHGSFVLPRVAAWYDRHKDGPAT